jgi:basic amino acid/polyamine antiporter, APA family
VILAFLFGQSRIFFVMARDGLLPRSLAAVSPRTGTPIRITALTAVLVGAVAGLVPLDQIAALANAGTLAAFTAVAVCMLGLARQGKGLFAGWVPWLVGPACILGCLYLFFSLPGLTRGFFLAWNGIGLLYYTVWKIRQ